jgi:CRP/FNR family transcriptional regulator
MFVLLSGRVHLVKPGPAGQEQILAVIEPVIMFNEVAVLDGGPNPMTAVAVKDTLTWNVVHGAFQELVTKYPVVGTSLLRVLAARNRALILRCEDLSYRSVQARLAKLLLDLSRNGEHPISRGEHPIREMAALIGTVPELVSRSLRSLQEASLIACSRSEISLTSPDGLARAAHLDLNRAAGAPAPPHQPS